MERYTARIVFACWIVFIVYWLINAFRAKPIAEPQPRLSAIWHRIPMVICYFLLAYPHLPKPFSTPLFSRTDSTYIAGATICGLGLLITLWARWTLAGNWSSNVTFKQGHELIVAGPYRFARHPIYTGLLLMCLGTAIHISCLRAWLALAVMFIGFWIKLKQEERLLIRHFPDSYPAYQQKVKALVPFVI